MVSLHDETLCSRKRDQKKVYGESFLGSFKRSKQGDQTQTKLDKTTTLFSQRSNSESATLIKPDVQLHLDAKARSESFELPKMSLDLELNLFQSSTFPVKTIKKKDECSKGLSRSPSWLAFEGDDDNQKTQEMVTTVCIKCHMLIMLCKSTLVCPNCKFMHPDDHRSTIYSLSL